jgi:hypothetical protein
MNKRKTDQDNRRCRKTSFDIAPQLGLADQLVGAGFRHWIIGHLTADVSCWERVWCRYCQSLGTTEARHAVTCLSDLVNTIRSCASREIVVAPQECSSLCRDECIAVSMVAACQRSACPAARACAFALLGNSDVNATIDAAAEFAEALRVGGAAFDMASVQTVITALPILNPARH